jgi:hypothetical protein
MVSINRTIAGMESAVAMAMKRITSHMVHSMA